MESKYERFFFSSTKFSSKSRAEVLVVKPDLFQDFIEEVAKDQNISLINRCIYIAIISGGLRVSELLSLNNKQLAINGRIEFKDLDVLKKRSKGIIKRDFLVSNYCKPLFQRLKSLKRKNGPLFTKDLGGKDINSSSIYYSLRRDMGLSVSPHSLRHSFVAFLVYKNVPVPSIANLMEMSVQNVMNYTHTNTLDFMDVLYNGKGE